MVAAVGAICHCFLEVSAPGFVASSLSQRHVAVGRSAAGKSKGSNRGFGAGSGGAGKSKPEAKPSKKPAVEEEEGEESESTELTKSTRAEKSSALTTSKLKDLRDKTLALRQKREAELDEYEEGRALIAKYGPSVGVMPAKVAQRAAKRGMVIGGSFYGTMLAVFAGAIALYKTQDIIIPPTLVAFITLALLALAIAGGSYGLMSASWLEDKEGSLLGFDEFGENVKAIGDGFRKASMQPEYEKALELRKERRALVAAKEKKKKELANKKPKQLLEG